MRRYWRTHRLATHLFHNTEFISRTCRKPVQKHNPSENRLLIPPVSSYKCDFNSRSESRVNVVQLICVMFAGLPAGQRASVHTAGPTFA